MPIIRRAALRHIPTPLAGLALGIAALGAGWDLMLSQNVARYSGAALAAMLLLPVLVKFLLHPLLLWRELEHPVAGGVVPTFSMATMLISAAAQPLAPAMAGTVWLLAVGLHLTFMLLFLLHRLHSFELAEMAPSWFVPPVGIVTAALTCPPEALELAHHLMWFGLANYCLLLPLMLYRLLVAGALPLAARPTLAILAAPANLCLAGYISVSDEPSLLLVTVLGTLAQVISLVIYAALIQLLRLPFSPAYAAFTFPIVIGATAMLKLEALLQSLDISPPLVHAVGLLAEAELFCASLMVAYVAFRYLRHYAPVLLNAAPRPQAA